MCGINTKFTLGFDIDTEDKDDEIIGETIMTSKV